jgi:hypothetical protein
MRPAAAEDDGVSSGAGSSQQAASPLLSLSYNLVPPPPADSRPVTTADLRYHTRLLDTYLYRPMDLPPGSGPGARDVSQPLDSRCEDGHFF